MHWIDTWRTNYGAHPELYGADKHNDGGARISGARIDDATTFIRRGVYFAPDLWPGRLDAFRPSFAEGYTVFIVVLGERMEVFAF